MFILNIIKLPSLLKYIDYNCFNFINIETLELNDKILPLHKLKISEETHKNIIKITKQVSICEFSTRIYL